MTALRPLTTLAMVSALALGACGTEPDADGPLVETLSGPLLGSTAAGVDSFLGIPYAAPPTDDLRWRAPQPVTAWSATRPATGFGDDCQQTPFAQDAAPSTAPFSEDCLFVNVWRPADVEPGADLPVAVWIHGGGFVNGGSSPAIYSGESFARNGVIYVSMNYRLGRFGFFAHPALTRENADEGLLGNYGYLDQIAALNWVEANIAAFGGDPDNVTIFGESAGGASVQAMLTSPLAQGLFDRAIIQSGGGRRTGFSDRRLQDDAPGSPSLESLGVAFAEAHGITGDGPAALDALRALPASEIDGGLSMASMGQQGATYGGPSIDGRIVTAPLQDQYMSGQFAMVPLMIGATSADLGFLPVATKADAFNLFGDSADAARAAYDPDGVLPDAAVISAIGGDLFMVEPARFVASRFNAAGNPVFHYRFSYVAEALQDTFSGAPHASEIPYTHNTLANRRDGETTTPGDQAVAELTHRYWLNFIRSGDPNSDDQTAWPLYSAVTEPLMDISASGEAVAGRDPWSDRLDMVCDAFAGTGCPEDDPE
ncbi:carboxylesterase/lipase family protein [Maricaulis parjimensis]|uniref:carboxylesterase/lipase family protein n=1 Tax=Maricaulis parjimensis TaxID=144023 RepID=UPI001939BC37|nr:carboxylesterase family protein [Maricaulis parjimensis]